MTWRQVALLSSAVVILGAVGPWHETVLGDYSGLRGDGRYAASLAAAAGLIIYLSKATSRWQLVAATLGIVAGIVAAIDLINIETADQELFGQQVELVSAGWGLWLSAVGSIGLAVGAFVYRAEALETSDHQ